MSNEQPVRSDCCPTCGTPKSVLDQMCSLYALHELLKERDEWKQRADDAEKKAQRAFSAAYCFERGAECYRKGLEEAMVLIDDLKGELAKCSR